MSAAEERAGHLRLIQGELAELGDHLAEGAAERPDAGDLMRVIDAVVAFVRHRLGGDYPVDEFGFDQEFAEGILLHALRPLYRKWFRVEVRGVENLPEDTAALLVSNHSGTLPFDALMLAVAVHDETTSSRFLRLLGADFAFTLPFVGDIARKSGATLATNADAHALLTAGNLVGVFPEGFKGVGKPFSERYRLQRFGRGGFVSAALRSGCPIIPCAIVGAEEIYPMLGNISPIARLLGVPYAPITPTWPLLGPVGLIPLPSKWCIEFGEPILTDAYGPDAAEDAMIVFDLTDQVRETIQQNLYALLVQRRNVFF